MRKLVMGFGGLLLLVLLIAAGGYGLYWYQVKSYLDQVAEELAPVAAFTYGRVYAHPLGEVGADDLNLTLHRDGTRIPIESIRLRSRDPLFLLDPQGRIEAGDWPPSLSLVVKQAQFDLNSPLAKRLEAQAAQAFEPGQISPDALGCGAVERIDLAALRKMGYNRVPLDLVAAFRFEPLNRQALFDLGTDLAGLGSTQLGLTLSVTGDNLAPAQLMSANPRVRHVELGYQDAGYNLRRDRFCAQQADVDVAAYREQHEQLMQQWLIEQGIQLPASLWQIYQGVSKPQARLVVTMDPPGGLGAEVMMGVGAPQELFDRLRLGVRLNEAAVSLDDVDLARLMLPPGERAGVAARPVEPVPSPDSASSSETPEVQPEPDVAHFPGMPRRAPPPPPKRYTETSLAALDGMVGLPVRVYTDLGNKLEGTLVGASGDLMRIETRVDQGSMIFPLEFTQVRRVEVYR